MGKLARMLNLTDYTIALVGVSEVEQRTSLVMATEHHYDYGKVVAVGPGFVDAHGKLAQVDHIAVGDYVAFPPDAGIYFRIGSADVVIMNADAVQYKHTNP